MKEEQLVWKVWEQPLYVHSLLMDPAGRSHSPSSGGAVLLKDLSSAGSRVGPLVCITGVLLVCVQESSEKPAKRENPHKYLLYKPTFSQLFTFLSASFKVSLSTENQHQVGNHLVLVFWPSIR